MVVAYFENLPPPPSHLRTQEDIVAWRFTAVSGRVRRKIAEIKETRNTPRNDLLVALDPIFPLVPRHTQRNAIVRCQFPAQVVERLLACNERESQRTLICHSDYFPEPYYVKAVRHQLFNEFPKLWKATIDGVIAESNSDYIKCYGVLREHMTSRKESFWDNWFQRSMRDVGNVLRLRKELEEVRCSRDRDVAVALNRKLAEEEGQEIECRCCFGDYPVEEMSQCRAGHAVEKNNSKIDELFYVLLLKTIKIASISLIFSKFDWH